MCEFCLKHGEGQKWYLQANNYSEDLLNDIRRRKMIENFAADGEATAKSIEKMDKLSTAPKFIQALVKRLVPAKMKKRHYGQVVPIEDVEKIFGFVNSIVRVACYCRHFTVGKEKRYCYGISMGPNGGKFGELMKNVDTSFLTGLILPAWKRLPKSRQLRVSESTKRKGFVIPYGRSRRLL